MTSLLTGIIIGIVSIGSNTQRVIEVLRGHVLRTLFVSTLISVSYYFSIRYIIEDDLPGYIGFSIGAALVTCYQAHLHNKYKLDKVEQKE
jgi:hypothetical protein